MLDGSLSSLNFKGDYMKKYILLGSFLIVVMMELSNVARGQCTDIFVPIQDKVKEIDEEKSGFRAERRNVGTEAEKKKKLEEGERVYPFVRASITSQVRFKISLDNDITSGFTKTNDYIVFSVLENVYGTAEFEDIEKIGDTEKKIPIKKRCVVIPKDTKVYGLVAHANSRYPFFIGGKAKLYVMVTKLKIDDGSEQGQNIKIKFAEPLDGEQAKDKDENIIKKCKYYNRECITGRREKLTFAPAIVGAGTASLLLTLDDGDTTQTVAALTFLESLSKISGVDSLVNPPNATLKSKMIFDVITQEEKPIQVWVSGLPVEKPKEKDEKSKDDKAEKP
jgi:hypothetical protein